jgi:intraflagellar transport protein 88
MFQVEVLYQIADLYLLKGDQKRARKMLHLTYDFVGSEPGLMARLGTVSSSMGNREESLQYLLEAHDQCPNIDTLAIVCTQYLHDEKYEAAARCFAQAALLQPNEPKWLLMVASCHRRAQKYELAMAVYEQV